MKFFDVFPFLSFLILIILLILRILNLRLKGIKIRSDSTKNKMPNYFIYPVFGVLLFFWITEILNPILSFSLLPNVISQPLLESIYFQIAGVILVCCSHILLLITLIHFNHSFRFGMNPKNLGKLVTNGIFSISRNPFFLSIECYFLGIAVMLPRPFLIGFALSAIIIIHIFILKEEKFMKENYGTDYQVYFKKVPRYFPF